MPFKFVLVLLLIFFLHGASRLVATAWKFMLACVFAGRSLISLALLLVFSLMLYLALALALSLVLAFSLVLVLARVESLMGQV